MDIRPSPIAGTWYPENPKTLAQTVNQFLNDATSESPPGRCWGVMAPHAGLRYSGPVAGYAFRSLRGLRPELVAVVGPLHHSHSAPVLTSAHEAYETPLGLLKVDKPAVDQLHHHLRDEAGFGLTRVREDPEHSLEIELPFLQQLFGNFSLLPLMIVNQRSPVPEALGKALASVLRGREALLVASTDLSHYHAQAAAQQLDHELLRRVEAFDPQGILEAQEAGVAFACGRGALAAVLWAARALGADRTSVLRYATSGDVTGDFSSVVGYGAAIIWQEAA